YTNPRRALDVSLGYSDGIYTARELDSNRRWGADFGIGKAFRTYQPYLRVGYGLTYFSFEHDMGARPGTASPRRAGEYFSPKHFLLNYGIVSMNHRFGKLDWEGSASLGVQHVQGNVFASFDTRFSYGLNTSIIWHINDTNEIRAGYGYSNVFNAFHQHIFRISWRHYF
ncbi:MAG TPA: cellulose synthase subunit BcsC-related outer membrane protein, partial [Candidatus Nitrosotenuis sp.]|nr:cellulose synthase subunit BcsC-related outer membrane protein [Candidatus Nitrosotenuis sp.]